MFRSWRLGSPFGIDLFVHWSFALLPIWIMFSNWGDVPTVAWGLALVTSVFGCVVLHELGHALAARYFGIPTRDITLYPIGGVARLERMSERPVQELCIALAGPLVNAVLAGVFFLLCGVGYAIWKAAGGVLEIDPERGFVLAGEAAGQSTALATGLVALEFVGILGLANVLLGGFNLLPAFPMDGGRVLRSVLAMIMPRLRATHIAANIGAGLALGLAILAFFISAPMLFLLAAFVFLAGRQELMMLRLKESGATLPSDASPRTEPNAEVNPVPPTTIPERFSGVLWDKQARVWVIWQDGRPVGTVGGPPPETSASSTEE